LNALRVAASSFPALLCGMRLQGLMSRCHHHFVLDQKAKEKLREATRSSVKKEMDGPRVAKSARIPDSPSITMIGTVKKIIPALRNY
jgi:hypothetical protein